MWTIAKKKDGFLLAILDQPPMPTIVIPSLRPKPLTYRPPLVTKPTYGPPPLTPLTYESPPFTYIDRKYHHNPFHTAFGYYPSIYHTYQSNVPPPTTTTPTPVMGAPAFISLNNSLNNGLISPNIKFDDAPKLVFGVSFRIRRVYGCEESDKLNCDTLISQGNVVDCDVPRFR